MPTVGTVRGIAGVSAAAILGNIPTGSKVPQIARILPIIDEEHCIVSSRILKDKMAGGSVGAMVFYHNEDQTLPYQATATATAAADGAAITFTDHYHYFNNYDLWRNTRTDEVVLAFPFTTRDATVDVIRGVGSTSGAAVAVGDIFERIGSAHEEGSAAPGALMVAEEQKTFYIGIHKRTSEITFEATKTETYHGNDRAHQNAKALLTLKRDLEMNLLWGTGTSDTTGASGSATRTAPSGYGLYNYLSSHRIPMPTVTYSELRDFFDLLSVHHTSGQFSLIAGPSVMGTISDFAYDAIRIAGPGETPWGVHVPYLTFGTRKVWLVTHPLLNGSYTSKVAFAIPEPAGKYMKMKTLAGLGLQFFADVNKNNDNRCIRDEWVVYMGGEYWMEDRFGLITGIITG